MSFLINQNIAAYNAYRNLETPACRSRSPSRNCPRVPHQPGLRRRSTPRQEREPAAEIGGTRQAIKRAQDGVSSVQTAEGALNEVHSILQRIRDLAVSAANTATKDGKAQQAEIDELVLEPPPSGLGPGSPARPCSPTTRRPT